MTDFLISLVPIALLFSGVQDADTPKTATLDTSTDQTATQNTKWLDETRIKINANADVKGMMPDFDKGKKTLKAIAKEACSAKQLGKPRIEGEVMVAAIGITPENKRFVTLTATYACQRK